VACDAGTVRANGWRSGKAWLVQALVREDGLRRWRWRNCWAAQELGVPTLALLEKLVEEVRQDLRLGSGVGRTARELVSCPRQPKRVAVIQAEG